MRGRIVDAKDNAPLIGANAVLIRLPDSARTGSAAGPDGSFEISAVQPGRYVLLTSFVGFQDVRQPLTVPAGGAPVSVGTVSLAAGGVRLKGVTVTGQARQATQRGDTTSLNARAFKTNPDATAGELVAKMPGISVDAQGNTSAQGEQVQQVLVDGKPFFGNDPNSVLRNLPAEAIDRVEIFDQQSEQSRFSGFNDGNTQKTLNFVTKKEYRNGYFGRVVAGAGPERYQGSLNLNDFRDARRLTLLAQSNNVNQQNFSAADLLGVVGNVGGRPGAGGSSAGNFLVSQNNGINTTNAAGLNFSDTWGRHTDLSASYFFNRAANVLNSNTFRQFVLPGQTSTTYAETALSNTTNTNHRANLRLDQRLDTATSLLLRPQLTWQQNDAAQRLTGLTSVEGQAQPPLNTRYDANNQAFNPGGDLLLRRRLGARAGRTLSWDINGNYSQRSGTSALQTTGAARPAANLNQQANLTQRGGSLGSNLNYTEPLGQHGQLQVNYLLSYAPTNSDRRTFNFNAADGQFSRLDSALSNVFRTYYLTQSGGLSYRYSTRQLNASVGLSGQVARLVGDATFPEPGPVRYTFRNLLPQAMLMWRPDREHNLRVFYRTSTSPPSIGQLQAVVNNSNPLQLTIGNPDLRQQFTHNLVARYSAAQAEKKSNFFALLGATITQDPIGNRTLVAARDTTVVPEGTRQPVRLPAGAQITQSANLPGQQFSLRGQASYGRPLALLKSNLNLNFGLTYAQNPGLVNGALNLARTPALNGGLTLSSNISPRLDFTLSTTASQNYVRNTLSRQLDNTFYNQLSRARLNWIVGPGISVATDLTHQFFRGLAGGFNQNFLLWNASVGKRILPQQRGEIKLYAFDLLGQNRAIQRNVTVAYFEDVQTTVLTRYVMLMFTYNLRSANMTLPTLPTEGDGPGGGRRGRGERGGPPDGPPPPGGGGFGGPSGG